MYFRLILPVVATYLAISCSPPNPQTTADQSANILIDSVLATTDRFDFHSHSLVNLHHYLVQTTAFIQKKGIEDTTEILNIFLKDTSYVEDVITDHEAERILSTMDYYKDQLIGRNLLFDSLMNHYRYEIMSVHKLSELRQKDLPDPLINALYDIYPIFEKYLWEAQKNSNIKWVAERIKLILRIEKNCLSKIARYYKSEFAWKKLRIDVCGNYTHWAGAYTSNTPYPSVVISSYRKNYQGHHGTEMVFHETTHTLPGVYENIQPGINEKCQAYKKGKHPRLWHAIMFYTTGMVAKEEMEKEMDGLDYSLFMHEYDVSSRYHEVLEKYWRPYLLGETEMENALDQMVKNL